MWTWLRLQCWIRCEEHDCFVSIDVVCVLEICDVDVWFVVETEEWQRVWHRSQRAQLGGVVVAVLARSRHNSWRFRVSGSTTSSGAVGRFRVVVRVARAVKSAALTC